MPLTTLIPGMSRTLTGGLFACLLGMLVVGCGGGPGDAEFPQEQVPAEAPRIDEIVARTGPIVAIRVGQTANLNDLNSYTSSDQPLSFDWSFSSMPDGSNAVLQNADSANPSFVADTRGDYRVQLVVSADGISSERAVQLVVVTVSPERPTGPANHEGLSSICVVCHSDEIDASPKPGKIPGKSLNHVATSSICETCHTPLGFDRVPFVDHQEVFGNCSGCHDNVLAIGKSEFHQPTSAECDSCHNTTSFFELGADGKFDHTGITSGCSGCHNGSTAIGKTPTATENPPGIHPVTSAECISCHTTASFLGAFPDHTDPVIIGPGCNSCHGVSSTDNITDPTVGHPVMTRTDMTTIDCGSCHGIATFSLNIANGEGGQFNHGLVDPAVLTCITCHNATNSINAPGRTPVPPAGTHPDRVDCQSCHTTDAFNPPTSVDHNDPAVLAARCDSCHGVNATGKPVDLFGPGNTLIYAHMQTTITNPPQNPPDRDCGDCHTPGTFTTGTFDHDLSFYSPQPACEDCHNNVITLGKLNNHIPTTQDCGACHLDTIDFRGATVNHATLSPAELTNCVSCHDGNIATGKPLSTHLPTDLLTNENCFECHNVPNTDLSFADASNFSHSGSGINGNCESCHSGNSNYVSVGAIGKKTNHIPALNGCVVCHDQTTTNPGDFSPAIGFLPNVHDAITNGCEGCHTGQFLPLPSNTSAELVKDVNHVPTAQDCDVCHTIAGFAPTTMLAHEGITGNCVSCHNGSFVTLGARAKTATPPHPVTSADCALCHDTISFANAFVDHNDPAVLAARCDSCHVANGTGTAKGMDVGHVVTTQDCGICHAAGGSFKPAVFNHIGIVDNCASCHDGTEATGSPNDPIHQNTTEDCSVCHNTTAFAGASFAHQGIVDNCVSCHNGTTATGKSNFHVPTGGDCVDCHQTTGFRPATFSHVGIVDNCSSCHDAGFARPKKTAHVPTTQDCGVCHNTSVFKPATFDHTGITNNCVSCHDGTIAKGKVDAVPAHIQTSLDCSSCHTTATFAGGTWTHDASSVNNCNTCHSPGGGAKRYKVVPPHLLTTAQCDVCHTTNGWAPTNFSHDPQGNYPGDHRRDPGCNACHGNTISATIPYRWPQYAPDCASCHANDFDRKGDHIGGENGTVSQNRNCAGSGCHRVSDREF